MANLLCTSCGSVGEPKAITKGSLLIEIILWLCIIVPGLIYSIWRHTSRYDGCRSCEHGTLIPLASPIAQQFLSANKEAIAKARAVEQASPAYRAGQTIARIFK